jgi:hypothetical protein
MVAAKSSTRPALTLDERIALETAPGWRPNGGEETLIEKATVVGLRMHHDEEYGDSPVVVYRKTDGKFIAVYAFHAVLRDRLAELKTNIGSVQTLKYLGSQTSNTRKDLNGDPQRYESYYVENDGAEVTAVAEGFTFETKAKP